MNEFAFMYVYVCMSVGVMLLDSVLINFICNYLYMHEFAFMYVYVYMSLCFYAFRFSSD